MGLNLPVRQVVLYDIQTFNGTDFQPLSTNSVWQRVGRAGRPGFDAHGEAILIAPTWDRDVDRYDQGRFEPIQSGLANQNALAEQIVAEVASGLAKTPGQLRAVFEQSLATRQQRLPNVYSIITDMCSAGMLQDDRDDMGSLVSLKVTRLGRIAVRHMLSPATVLLFHRVLKKCHDLTFLDLLIVAACTPDCEPILPVDFEELDNIASSINKEPSYILQSTHSNILTLLGVKEKRLLAALKMALVARTWTRLADATVAADHYNCYPFEIERLCESLNRLLMAMSSVFDREEIDDDIDIAWREHQVSLYERVRALQHMIHMGLDDSAVTLTLISGIGAKMAKQLQAAGIRDIEELALAEPEALQIVPRLSAHRATKWIQQAMALVKSHSAFAYRETGATAAIVFRRNNCTAASLCKASLTTQFFHHTDHFGGIAKVLLKGTEDRCP
jgi:helicase